MKDDTLLELRKDIVVPGRFYQAGTKKTLAVWRLAFPKLYDTDIPNWFLDCSRPVKQRGRKSDREIVNEVFTKRNLYSISYREAAVRCIEIARKQEKSTPNPDKP